MKPSIQELKKELRFFSDGYLNVHKHKTFYVSRITLVPDGRYGDMDETGHWRGMIGELVYNKVSNHRGPSY